MSFTNFVLIVFLEVRLAQNLGLHPLDPLRPLLGCLERFRVVAGVPPHLPISRLDDEYHAKYLPLAVVVDPLHDPQPRPHQHPPYPDAGRGRVAGEGLLERPHVLGAPDALAGLGHLHGTVLVSMVSKVAGHGIAHAVYSCLFTGVRGMRVLLTSGTGRLSLAS